MEFKIGGDPVDVGLQKGSKTALDRSPTILCPDDNLAREAVVVRWHAIASEHMTVDPNPNPTRRVIGRDQTRAGHEVERVLSVDPQLKGMAFEFHVFLTDR